MIKYDSSLDPKIPSININKSTSFYCNASTISGDILFGFRMINGNLQIAAIRAEKATGNKETKQQQAKIRSKFVNNQCVEVKMQILQRVFNSRIFVAQLICDTFGEEDTEKAESLLLTLRRCGLYLLPQQNDFTLLTKYELAQLARFLIETPLARQVWDDYFEGNMTPLKKVVDNFEKIANSSDWFEEETDIDILRGISLFRREEGSNEYALTNYKVL